MHYKKIFINGQWIEPSSSERIKVENPADKSIVGSVPAGKKEDVDLAVKAAKEALPAWQCTPLEKRIELTESLLFDLRKKTDKLSDTIVKELGCTKTFAKNTHIVPYLHEIKELIKLIKDYPLEEKHKKYTVVKEAVGVVGALTPWNYPLGQIIKKLAPALLSGSTMVLKPSQNTPLVAYLLTESIDKVGFPKGVFNLVPGRGSEVGNPLATHPDVDLLTFTGSTDGGREVAKLAVDDVKRITLELGGKSPAVILKGADLDSALSSVLDDIYRNTGQSCSALSRLIVPLDEKEKIEKMIVEKTKAYTFGDPRDPEVQIGPLASKKQFDKVKAFIEKGIEEGATILLGEVPEESSGYYVEPLVFTDVKNSMVIAQEEIFGPVLCLITYETPEEAIEIANDNKYGLSSAVFGPDDKVMDVAKRLKAGEVLINDGSSASEAPFGGYKHSGFGREGGKYGLEEFLEIKVLFI